MPEVNEISWPTVSPGVRVVVQLKDGKFTSPQGKVCYLPTPPEEKIVVLPSECNHEDEICAECIDTWAIDFYVVLASELDHPSNPTL